MDYEQLEKRVEWLDKERRENLSTINKLTKRIGKLERLEKKSNQFVKEVSSDLVHLSVQITKIDEFDDALIKHKKDVKNQIDKQNKLAKNREKTVKTSFSNDFNILKFENETVKNDISKLNDLNEKFDEFDSKMIGYAKQISQINEKSVIDNDLISTATLKVTSLEDELRISNNQSNEITGEMNALRKKVDAHSSQIELAHLSQKKMEDRWAVTLADHVEKTGTQFLLFEEIQRGYHEQKAQWIKWNQKITEVAELSNTISADLLNLDEAERSLKNARAGFQGITEQIERRINEITEIQRLGDERYRQEWVTFKSDQQKRWTNQTLTQDEQHKNLQRKNDRIETELNNMISDTDKTKELVDVLVENSDKRLSVLMNHFREWLSESEKQTKKF
jgi:chromosome segregation ATPase